MQQDKWKQTKRELKRLENGSYVPERITEERVGKKFLSENRKELIDLIVKTVGVLSIFIPLFLLYYSYNRDVETKRNENLAQLYSDISFDLENLINAEANNSKFQSSAENLLFKHQAKLSLFKHDSLNEYYSYLKDLCIVYKSLKEILYYKDSMIAGYYEVYNHYRAEYNPDEFTIDDTYKIVFKDSIPLKLKQIENTRQHLSKFRVTLSKYENSFSLSDRLPLKNESLESNSMLNNIRRYSDTADSYAEDINEEFKALADFLLVKDPAWFEDYFGHATDDRKTIDVLSEVLDFYSLYMTLVKNELAEKRRMFEEFLLKHIR